MKVVSRSAAAGNSSMPPTANMVSGKTSVWATPALTANASAALPGTVEACGVNASKPDVAESNPPNPPRRSPISRIASADTSRITPCRNSAGLSTATAPTAATRPGPAPSDRCTLTTAPKAASRPARLSVIWMG